MAEEQASHFIFQKRISPWIKKKLNEIIGEDEPTLIVFITDKLSAESKPEQILSEIRVVLGLYFCLGPPGAVIVFQMKKLKYL